MSGLKFEVKVMATGEVRDVDGNLISSEPVETTMVLTAEELDKLGIPHPPHPDQEM